MDLSDEDVVARVLAGDVNLFEIVMRRHNQRIYRVIRAVLRSDAEAEDAMQEAYLLAFTHLAQFQGTAKFTTWLTRIAINSAIARIRRSHPHAPEEAAMDRPSDKENPEETASRHELGALLEHAIDALPEIYRLAIVLRDVEGLSTAEAGAMLGVSDDVIKQRLVRGRSMVEHQLVARTQQQMHTAFAFHAVRCDRVVTFVLQHLTIKNTAS